MASRMMLVLLGALAYVQGAAVDKVQLMTSGTAQSCAGAAISCDGGFERDFTPGAIAATNVVPQVLDVKLKYVGGITAGAALPGARYMSVVDKTLNNNDPCTNGAYAAAARDTFHSGPLLADTDGLFTLTPTAGANVQLDASKEYAICYSTTANGDAAYGQPTATWLATGIFLKVSKIEKITAYARNFKTEGTIPHHPSLTMTYTGTVLTARWISFVDDTLNSNNPCADGMIAAAPLDSSHSGSLQANAGTSTFVVNTAALSGTKRFAVCYAESGGITSSQWRDSGIRVKRSKIEKMQYGVDSTRYGDGFVRDTYNRNTNDVSGTSTDMFPQIAGSKLRYVGADAPDGMHISLVDQTINSNDPCGKPVLAAAVPSFAGHAGGSSPSPNEMLYSGASTATNKIATIVQGNNELLAMGTSASPKVYAVCYATGDGSVSDPTWADSYARYKLTMVEALKHHSVLHVTTGVLPYTGGNSGEELKLEYIGSLAAGGPSIKFTLVQAQSNPSPAPSINPYGVDFYEPCGSKANAETAAGTGKASGVLASHGTKKFFQIDTTGLSTGTTTGDTLAVHEFAVCYTDDSQTSYRDSGIRVAISKISHVTHGTQAVTDYNYAQRLMKPVENTGVAGTHFNAIPSVWQTVGSNGQTAALSPGLASARNVIPQMPNQQIKYFSSSQANAAMVVAAPPNTDSLVADNLGAARFISLVSAELNGNKPCAIGTSAAAAADTLHSGAITAAAGVATIPQATPLDHTKVFAVCYAITSGTTADPTWADSYVRVTISKVHTVQSLGVSHSVSAYDGQIAVRRTTTSPSTDAKSEDAVTGTAANYGSRLDLSYTGTLAASGKLAFVDESINAGFACATVFAHGAATAGNGPTAAAGSTTTGALTASSSAVLTPTDMLDYSKTFSVCYSEDGTTWYDTGIRFTRSPIYSMRYSSGFTDFNRDQTSVALATNQIPQSDAIQLLYMDPVVGGTDELANDAYLSLVDASLNNNNPCVVEATCEATADATHSGPVKATQVGGGAGGKYVTFSTIGLGVDSTFAVCYHAPDNVNEANVNDLSSNNGDVWKDSYVRLTVSQIEGLRMNLGKWKGACLTGQAGCAAQNGLQGYPGATGNTITGLTQTHKTIGQLPQMQSNDEGLEVEYYGTLGASAYISLVDASLNPTQTSSSEISIPKPCDSATVASASADSTHSGAQKGTTYGFCQTANQGDRGNVCSDDYTNVWTKSCVQGARCKPADPNNGGCGSAGRCSGSHVFTLATETLDKTKTYALCYTKAGATDTPAGDSTDTWRDSGVRITVSKINHILTSSRYPGIAARQQSAIYQPINRIPTSTTMKFTYVGELAVSKYISFVDAATATTGDNPCVQHSVARGSANTVRSGPLSADGNKVFAVPNTAPLDKTKTFAVCYSEAGIAAGTWWMDSGIRMGVTQIESLRTWGIDATTTGQVPNTEAGLKFTFVGSLAANSWLSLVDQTENSNFPCTATVAGEMTTAVSSMTAAKALKYTGYRQSGTSDRDVVDMETYKLSTTATFAVCYADKAGSGNGGNTDASWADSGIRVTVPEVWNMMAASGYTGPACSFNGERKVNTNCKDDTKPRDMTTKPLPTNRIANVNNQALTYNSEFPANQYISIVSAALNPSGPDPSSPNDDSTGGAGGIGNPCVNAAVANPASPTATATGGVQANGNTVTFPSTGSLNTAATYAVCYSNGGSTYHDSYVRLKVSQIEQFVVRLPHVKYGTTTSEITTHQIPIRTYGQIPNQAPSEQVLYQYAGSLPTARHISLVESQKGSAPETYTGFSVPNPCAMAHAGAAQTANDYSGKHLSTTVAGEAKVVQTLDSQVSALNPASVYALCYTDTAGGVAGANNDAGWADSGIRITVPKMYIVKYAGTNGNVIPKRVREMTAIHLPTNKLPAAASVSLTYTGTGPFGTNKYVSLVAATDALPTPCVNPAQAGANVAASPRAQASAGAVSFDVTALDATAVFAVCYAEAVDGGGDTNQELSWRDSYIRLSVSTISKITSYQVEHLTTGQLPNHAQLKIDYDGSLAAGGHMKLIDASHAMVAMGSTNYPIPCASATHTGMAPDTAHTNIGSAPSGTKTVQLNTVDLDVYDASRNIRYWDDMGVATTEVYYAVCYSSTAANGPYYDSGIRVTMPGLINVQFDSGHSAVQKVCVKSGGANVATNCDHDFDTTFNGQCALGTPCDSANANNGGCGDSGACGYQERCTAVGGTGVTNVCDVNFDGAFSETCQMNALCESSNANNGGCGSQGVCARQGTAVREQTSWDQTDGSTLVETPTNRLPQVTGETLKIVPHPTAVYGTAAGTTKLSIVKVDAGANSFNPCVIPAQAAATGSADGTGDLSVNTVTGIVTVTQGTLLGDAGTYTTLATREALIFAVCYGEGGGAANTLETWRDSYVRLKITELQSLITVGVTHKTTGQIPNVVSTDQLRFNYVGTLDHSKYLSFVDASANSGLPCVGAYAGKSPAGFSHAQLSAWGDATTNSGVRQAVTSKKFVEDFDTSYMDTSKTFALCYTDSITGGATSATWADSGLRVTLPKVYNVQFSSQTDGPALLGNANTKDGLCRPGISSVACNEKYDTMPRGQTSNPLPTNTFPRGTAATLMYRGALALGKTLSLVATDSYGQNPCILPFYAGGAASSRTTKASAGASSSDVTLPQSTSLEAEGRFAVCYAEGSGDMFDHTWRDSYIRLTVTQVRALEVNMPHVNHDPAQIGPAVNQKTTIVTFGQLPNQAASQQVSYSILGTIPANQMISLTNEEQGQLSSIDIPDATTGFTGIPNYTPCAAGTANPGTASSTATQGKTAAATTVSTLDTTILDTTKTYAVCYNLGTATWFDSGLRVTVSQITKLQYKGQNNDVLDSQIRDMSSVYLATNTLPQVANVNLNYVVSAVASNLGTSGFVSIVGIETAANQNMCSGGCPCATPAKAATNADSTHSGAVGATSSAFTVLQSTPLVTSKLFAVCYASAGSASDVSWRDSYIRLTVSEISAIVAHSVTHTVRGQIPSHPTLLLDTVGNFPGISGSNNNKVTLVDARLGSLTMGAKIFPYPCSSSAIADGAENTERAKMSDDALSASIARLSVDTTELKSAPIAPAETNTNTGEGTEAAGHARYYAVCYLDTAGSNTKYADSGIRLTVPEITNMQVNSGYGDSTRYNQGGLIPTSNIGYGSATGTPWRDQTSQFLSTNRLPKMTGQYLWYMWSKTSNACTSGGTGGADPSTASDPGCENGESKYIALVAASVNNNNPCVLTTETTKSADGTHSGPLTASTSANLKTRVTIDASGLNDVDFAVCYSKGSSLWDADPAKWDDADTSRDVVGGQSIWRDSYVRLKLSMVETVTTLGVVHRTFGQVPDTIAADSLDFAYTGPLAAESYLALVDASRNSEVPCGEASQTTFDASHSAPVKAGKKKCVSVGASPANTCDVSENGSYDEACVLNALCTNDAGCGTNGQCSATVSGFTTHGLSTNAGESDIYVGAQAPTTVIKARHFAVCYATSLSASWHDSGIRVSISRIHSLRLSSDYSGTPDRDHTSAFLPTNRLPVADNQYITYHGALAASKYVSLVATTAGNMNPCVAGSTAAAVASSSSTGPLTSGVTSGANNGQAMTTVSDRQDGGFYSTKTFDVDALTGNLAIAAGQGLAVYAVCYNENANSLTSPDWYDSYIRLSLTDIDKFGTKGVMHKTTGQLPHHKAGLVYDHTGTASLHSIALVDATLNTIQLSGFSKTFPDPCDYSAIGTSSTQKTGPAGYSGGVINTKRVNELNTANLDTTQTYALCYSARNSGQNLDQSAADLWRDSGIRVTVSRLDTIFFSGYTTTQAAARGKLTRAITSVLPSLQDVGSEVAMVLPKMNNLPLRYGGDIVNSRYISLVEVTGWTGSGVAGGSYGSNPCVPHTNAAGAATTSAAGSPRSGPVYACSSAAGLCDSTGHPTNGGTAATAAGNKEVTLPVKLDASKIYTVCYYDTQANPIGGPYDTDEINLLAEPYVTSGRTVTGSPTWVDSYVRVQISDVYSVAAAGVTHTDHGHLANHELAAGMQLAINSDTVATSDMRWFSLIDQTIGTTNNYGAGELFGVASKNEPCSSAALAGASPTSGNFLSHAADRTGPFRAKQITLHKVRTLNSECGNDFTSNTELSAGDKTEYAAYVIGEDFLTWGCPQSTTWSAATKWTNGGEAGAPGANGDTYVVEFGTGNVVSMITSGLATGDISVSGTKTYALCYTELNAFTTKALAGVAGVAWRDSGLRMTMSKLHTVRDNIAQMPTLDVLNPIAAGSVTQPQTFAVPMSMFARELTSSRAKVGRSRCLYIGASPAPSSNCDADGNGVYDEQCVVGAFCDPDLPSAPNGGCGGQKGVCNSGTSVRALAAAAGNNEAAAWSRTVYNNKATAVYHKIRTPSSGTLTMQYFGTLGRSTPSPTPSGKRQVALVDTVFNFGEPCASPALLSHSFTSNVDHTAPVTVQDNSEDFSFPATQIQALSESKVYTVCYSASSTTPNEPWYDSYVRFTPSKVDAISSHGITHRTQGQIANSDSLAVTYHGSIGSDGRLSLVAETEGNYNPCNSGSASADNKHSGAQTAQAGSNTVHFNTQALNTELNFAVCYSASGSSTFSDSGIRVTISRITRLEYNKQSSSGETQCAFGATANCYISQRATEDYVRTMPSKNTAPASDVQPLATNRIAVNGAKLDFIYNGNLAANPAAIGQSLGNGQFIALVATSGNTDANPCVSTCAGSVACTDAMYGTTNGAPTNSNGNGVLRAGDTTSTGVITASANSGTFRVDQGTNNLDATKEYAVCYAQIDSFDGVSSSAGDVDEHTFRDSYIRLLPSKVYTISAYGIDHYTFGDIPAKPALAFTATGTLAASAFVSLVDQTLNSQQPCSKTIAGKANGALSTAEKQTQTGPSTLVTTCQGANIATGATAGCDLNNDGVFAETCAAVGDLCNANVANPCGGGTCSPSGNVYKLKTDDLNADKTFAVCFTEGNGQTTDDGWTDSGIRVQTPQVQSITYGSPTRVISAASCFGPSVYQYADSQPDLFDGTSFVGAATVAGLGGNLKGMADCQVPLTTRSTAHYQIGAMLPRAAGVQFTYNGPSNGAGLAAGMVVSLVEQTTTSGENQKLNPCRDHVQAAAAADSTPATSAFKGTLAQPDEGGARLHSGAVTAGAGTTQVSIPQTYSVGGNTYNRLDATKTYAVCYGVSAAAQTAQPASANGGFRDSYIRVTLSRIKELKMVHSGYPQEEGHSVTTIGTFTSVPSLEVQWEGSLMTNQFLRLTAASLNNGAPCDKDVNAPNQAAFISTQVTAGKSTVSVASLAASRRLTFDTSGIANPSQVDGFFAVCYALGNGQSTDTTWRDSGLRVRFVRWTNPEKHRVVTGAPARLTFSISTGRFDTERDRVVFMKGETDCLQAVSAPSNSDGSNVMRTMDYVCTAVSSDASATKCDARFDGSFNQKCVIGAMCDTATANAADNGGCGTSGKCEGAVQLPSGNTYTEIQDVSHLSESALGHGNYAMCVCLGTASIGTGIAADVNSYGPANGNGGCATANDYTLVFSSSAQNAAHRTLHIISEPQLGRFLDVGGQLTLRHVAGKGHQYHIRATDNTTGYEVKDGDSIFFVPAGFGCGHSTKYSGDGTHVYDHNTNLYVSSGVDRRWRASVLHMCTSATQGDAQSTCDTNYDGVYSESCVQYALCDISNPNNGGCGASGTCGSIVPALDVADRTSPATLSGYSASTKAATFTTPAALQTVQQMTACFATSESLAALLTGDSTDYVPLTHGLEVIGEPHLGGIAGVQAALLGGDPPHNSRPVNGPVGRVYALENSSPSFTVTTMKAQDMYFFVPQTQSQRLPVTAGTITSPAGLNFDDCTPEVCTSVGGSNVATAGCDSDRDGQFDDACVFMARCDSTAQYNGGCGTTGVCEKTVPTTHTSMYTGLIEGTNFACSGSTCSGQLSLPTGTPLAVPSIPPFPTSWNMAICVIPAGARKDMPSNVFQLTDVLTIIKEPTDSLVTSWFQYQVAELRFTQPQAGVYGHNFATGLPGDIVVLQKDNCNNVHTVDPSTYSFTTAAIPYSIHPDTHPLPSNVATVPVRHSAKFVLGEAGEETAGDENGGTALELALATGKVNELDTGIYKICYATYSSGGESQADYKELVRELEILPAPATRPSLSTPRSIVLGQDIVVHWSSNIGLQTVDSVDESWLGLYSKDACEDTHNCFIAFQNIHAREATGTVIFSQTDYKVSGQYEVRYFKGDTRNGQGVVCGGAAGVAHETYVACNLQAATQSETIEVLGQDVEGVEELSYTPGLEAVFGNGNRGRYHRTKLT